MARATAPIRRRLPRLPEQAPLAHSWGAAAGLVLLALAPNIVVTTAFESLMRQIGPDVHLGVVALHLVEGLSNAGYAFGAVLAAQLMQRFHPRRLLVLFQLLFVVGSALAASAAGPGMFVAGRILQGFTTGLLLVAALPPLITAFGTDRLPRSAAITDMAFFGAVMVGPMAGGFFAARQDWRLFFAMIAVLGVLGLVLAVLTFQRVQPLEPELPLDTSAILFAFGGMGLTFTGVTELQGVGFTGVLFLAPVLTGVVCILALLVLEFRRAEPLMPVHQLKTTLPVAGILTAMVAGAVVVTLILLVQTATSMGLGFGPSHAGRLFWPGVIAVILASAGLGAVFRTRFMSVYALAGMLLTVGAAAAVLAIGLGSGDATILVATGLIGLAAGATVSPALFLAAFGVKARQIGRTFALVELLRSAAAYLLAPVLLYVVTLYGHRGAAALHGVQVAAWICLGLTAAGTLAIAAIYRAGGGVPHPPNLEQWLEEGEHAIDSRPFLARLRDAEG